MGDSLKKQLQGLEPKVKRRSRQHVRKKENATEAASYARFSTDMQNESSNDDQHRTCSKEAAKNEHVVDPKFTYSDEAVSGTKADRIGLNRLIADAKSGKFSIIYFHSLSRLARESLIGMSILKTLVRNHGIRVISVSEGIDTSRDGWEMHANLLFMFHEKFIEQLAADVLRAQEGVVLSGNSVGDHRFGFTSTPIPNAPPRGKGKKLPKEYGINREEAKWVIQIFDWFVEGKYSITQIVKLLNKQKVPKGHRSQKDNWGHPNVISILESTKYVGLWPWGLLKNHRDPETGRIWQEPRDENELSEGWSRYRPDLKIIDLDLFKAAQERLMANREENAKHRKKDGTFNSRRGSRGNPPRHLLSGLIFCKCCGHKFYIGGSNGRYLFCPNFKRGVCEFKTNLRKDLATKLVLELVWKTICEDEEWLSYTFACVLKAWEKSATAIPGEIASLQRLLDDNQSKIDRLLSRVENGSDSIDIDRRLRQREVDRRTLRSQIEDLAKSRFETPVAPTLASIKQKLQELIELNGELSPATIDTVQKLLGGRIDVEEIVPAVGRRFVRGELTMKVAEASKLILERPLLDVDAGGNEDVNVSIDFKDPHPLLERSEVAKELYDLGKLNTEIKTIMGISKSMVTKLIRFWFESRGQVMPDGRSRRSTLTKMHVEQPLYQRISDDVKKLMDEGLLLQDIAERLGYDRNTITAAAKYWYHSRKLEYPDGRERRKTLKKKDDT